MSVTKIGMPAGAVATLDDDVGFVALVDRMQTDPALKVVNAARISYQKRKDELGPEDEKLARFLLQHAHTSQSRRTVYRWETHGRHVVNRESIS